MTDVALEFDPTDLERTDDPYALLASVRAGGPVRRLASGYWAVTGHAAALEVLRHPRCGSSPIALRYLDGLPPGAARDEMSHRINFLDPPDHPRVRGIVARAFTPRRIAELRPWIEQTADALLDELGADAGGVLVSDAAATIEKTRIIAHHQQVVRLDREPYRPGGRIEQELVRRVARELPRVQVVIVSDYGKGTIHPALLDLLAERRDRDGFLYLIDPKQPNFPHYRRATLVKPNEGETAAAAGMAIDGPDALEQAAATLLERWQSDAVLISRGEHGMSLCRRGAPPRNFPAAAREVFDVTGAGDTVLAIAALALAGGGTLEEAAWLANVGAGVVVGKVGTATLRNEELGEAVVAAIADAREGRARG